MPLDQASRRACYCDRLRLIFAGPAAHPCQAQALAKKSTLSPKNPFCVEFSRRRRESRLCVRTDRTVPGQQLYTSYATAANCSHFCGTSGSVCLASRESSHLTAASASPQRQQPRDSSSNTPPQRLKKDGLRHRNNRPRGCRKNHDVPRLANSWEIT